MENRKWEMKRCDHHAALSVRAGGNFVFSFPFSIFHFPFSLGEELPLRPNPGPEQLPPEPPWLAILAATAVIGSAALLAWFVWRRWQRRAAAPSPPHVSALAELARIAGLKLTDARAVNRFYVLVTDVVRRYLNARFEVNAIGQTTPELIQSVRECCRFSDEQQAMLDDMLAKADLVKFARECPPAEAADAFLTAVQRFIHETASAPRQSPPQSSNP